MIERKRRKLPEIFGIDREYSKAIDTPLPPLSTDDTAPHSRALEQPASKDTSQIDDSHEPRLFKTPPMATGQGTGSTSNLDPVQADLPAKPPKEEVVRVRPPVRPLARQNKEILALEEIGYRREVIMKLARKNTQRRLKLTRDYKPAERNAAFVGKEMRLSISMPKADVDALSKQAGDLGTLSAAELIRSQVEPVWIKELDAVITALKGKQL